MEYFFLSFCVGIHNSVMARSDNTGDKRKFTLLCVIFTLVVDEQEHSVYEGNS